jgi:hypothetical protein
MVSKIFAPKKLMKQLAILTQNAAYFEANEG